MQDLNLPEPIAAYFAADRRDGAAVARCFTNDGSVKDEGQTHTGHDAIEAWKDATSAKFPYVSEPFQVEKADRAHVITSRVTGDFPGSPVNLRYRFTLERGLIAALEIAP